jgi:hypothetical protein
MDNKLLLQDAVSEVSEIDYEGDNVLKHQRLGAIAVNELVARFSNEGDIDDYELLALVLVRFKDLQVRDYAMGLANNENKDQLFNLWYWLMNIAPIGYIAPVSCIFAACAYETGESELAHQALDKAFLDLPSYPLGLLLRRVFQAGWPADSFMAMRAQLHPKICASLFGSSI